jgi:mevalonate kinase
MGLKSFYSHGKLLLTGEYAVLDGAKALAFPCKLGQRLKVETSGLSHFKWISYLQNNEVWQEVNFTKDEILNIGDGEDFKDRLINILQKIYWLKPQLFREPLCFSTNLEFNKNWGLGSSSTLINNLASWANIDPYVLLERTFGGSGYDIAAASRNTPFVFQKANNSIKTKGIVFPKILKPFIYFIYLNQKQNSREGIKHYRAIDENKTEAIDQISAISENVLTIKDLKEFETLMENHEILISKLTQQMPVHAHKFSDYTDGIVKSLGAWGGDFVMVTAKEKHQLDYFKRKGYTIIFNYSDLILDENP